MRRDRLYLEEMVEAADAIASILKGCERADFLDNDTIRSAVVFKLIIIGEAAARVSSEVKERHPSVPWGEVVAFRNTIVHEYFGLSWPIVWTAATEEVPDLRRQISAVLTETAPGSPDEPGRDE